jgi:hypothetical protein
MLPARVDFARDILPVLKERGVERHGVSQQMASVRCLLIGNVRTLVARTNVVHLFVVARELCQRIGNYSRAIERIHVEFQHGVRKQSGGACQKGPARTAGRSGRRDARDKTIHT